MALSTESTMNELQRVQLCAQILVCGHFLQGTIPEEPLMVGAFSDTTSTGLEQGPLDEGRHVWEKTWSAASMKAAEEAAPPGGSLDTTKAIAPRFVENMPTATRTSLTAAFQNEDCDLEDTREKKRLRQCDDDDVEEQDMEKIKKDVEDADSVVASILEHRKSLQRLLGKQEYDQGQLASVVLAFEAAASAAKAAAAAADLAYIVASQAAAIGDGNGESESDHLDHEQVSCIALRAVSQAQTAMEIDCSSGLRPRKRLSGSVDRSIITEGVTVEVFSGHPEGWLTAKVLTVKDGMVLVSYHELLDDSKNHITEWLQIESDSAAYCQHPRIRCPYPTFDLNETHEEVPKSWTVGDHVDVRVGKAWREGLVVRASDEELIVFYSIEGILKSVKLCDVRPSLLWRENKWSLWKDQISKEANVVPDLDNTGDNGETGPSPNHKMRKLIDVILEENESQRKKEMNRSTRQKRNGDAKSHSKVASKVNKAKKLIEKASKVNLQVSGSRLTRQFLGKLSPAAASGNSSKVVFTKRHQMLRQLVKLKASPGKSLATQKQQQQQQQNQTANKSERPQRLIQPTAKVVDFFSS